MIIAITAVSSFFLGFGARWWYSLLDGPWVKYPPGSGWSGKKDHERKYGNNDLRPMP